MSGRSSWPQALATARQEQNNGRLDEASRRLAGAVSDPAAPEEAVKLLASLLRAQQRHDEAVLPLRELARRRPDSSIAEHNLAAALGDAGDAPESEQAARRAIAKGGSAPETRLVLGRALVMQGRLEEAEASFRAALSIRPDFLPAYRDLAQLLWMQHGDPERLSLLLEPLAAQASRNEAAALLLSSILRDTAGDEAALASLQTWTDRPSVELALASAAAASGVSPQLALSYAEQARMLGGTDPRVRTAWLSALIASGRADEAVQGLEEHLGHDPQDQYARALLATAWRQIKDVRALTSDDYQHRVRAYRIGPEDEAERAAWLVRTAKALRRLHPFRSHPFQQSVRDGAQSIIDPRMAGDPDIDRLFEFLKAPIDAYVREVRPDWLGEPACPPWRIAGAWSVKLAAGGRHTDHVHARAWVSSAVYIETPPAVEGQGRGGWLRFGAAQIGECFALPAEHWVKPEPGSVVLFPSGFWHGTEPFDGLGERLTVAFDLLPKEGF